MAFETQFEAETATVDGEAVPMGPASVNSGVLVLMALSIVVAVFQCV
jgi:hypothetical protein